MGNSPSNILFRFHTKGHITDEEYNKLKNAITVARDENEPTTFIGDRGAYDSCVHCVKCGYKTTQYVIYGADAKYCPNCGRQIKGMIHNKIIDEYEQEVEYRNTLQKILDSGIFCYKHEQDALEYAIFLIQKEIDGEVD